jgi:hypothetical protein
MVQDENRNFQHFLSSKGPVLVAVLLDVINRSTIRQN